MADNDSSTDVTDDLDAAVEQAKETQVFNPRQQSDVALVPDFAEPEREQTPNGVIYRVLLSFDEEDMRVVGQYFDDVNPTNEMYEILEEHGFDLPNGNPDVGVKHSQDGNVYVEVYVGGEYRAGERYVETDENGGE